MKIFLVYPPIHSHTNYWLPHLGLGYLAACLSRAGHEVKVIDLVAEGIGLQEFARRVEQEGADIVAVTSTTCEIDNAHEICRQTKEINSKIITMVGGAHTTALPVETLENFSAFDMAFVAEGEHKVVEVVRRIQDGKQLNGLKGVAYRDNGALVCDASPSYINDLDKLPFPDWSKFNLRRYYGFSGVFQKELELPIITGRGCPYSCVFCQQAMGKKMRFRSVESVIDETEYDLSLGARALYFCDDTFSLNSERLIAMCEIMQKRGLHTRLHWSCDTRVNKVNEEMLRAMKAAGCWMVSFGAESGNDEILKHSKKGIKVEDTEKAFALARKVGLKTFMLLVFGLPFETEETIQDTMDMMLRINPDYVSIGILVPFPGTEALAMAKNRYAGLRLVSEDWKNFGKHMGEALELEKIPQRRLKYLQSAAYARFYLRPTRIINLVELASVKGIFNMVANRFSAWKST